MLRITDVVKHLLFLNILMFLASMVFKGDNLALHYPLSDKFEPYQIATHFFMHANFPHLFFNMFALVMFGSALEMRWGPRRFLFFYFFCAFGAALLHILYTWWDLSHLQSAVQAFSESPSYETYRAFFREVPLKNLVVQYQEEVNRVEELLMQGGGPEATERGIELMQLYVNEKMGIPVVGASGAIYGLLLGFGVYFPNAELMLIFLPIPIKAKFFIPLLMVAELFLGVNQFSWDNIAHFAHLGGALSGLLLILYWKKIGGLY